MHQISVSLVYGTAQKQSVYEARVARGTSALELIEISGFMDNIESLRGQAISSMTVGVFSQKVSIDYLLREGDRLEIYRPLTADPKEVRRQLALMGKTMGQQ